MFLQVQGTYQARYAIKLVAIMFVKTEDSPEMRPHKSALNRVLSCTGTVLVEPLMDFAASRHGPTAVSMVPVTEYVSTIADERSR